MTGAAEATRPASRRIGHPGWLVGYGAAAVLAFPQRVGDFVIDGGLWLGPLSVTFLLVGIAGLAPARAARRAFLASWLANAAILHWIYVVTARYGGAPPAIGVLAVLGIALYPAAATSGVAAAIARLGRGGFATPLVAAAVWTLGDHLRSIVGGGFPWALLGYTQLANPGLMPWAAIGSVFLVGFGAALGGALLAALFTHSDPGPRRLRGVATGTLVWIALHAYGLSTSVDRDATSATTTRIAVLQGNIEQGEKWTPENRGRTFAHYETLTRAAAAAGAELIVWPETAIPSPIELDMPVFHRLSELAREVDASLIVGAVGVDVSPMSGSVTDWYDSAFAIEPDGRYVARYDKTKLVPFGEYVPLRALLGRFIHALARGSAALDVSAGRAPVALQLAVADRDGERVRSIRLGVPICYELLFPELVRHFVADGAELLVAITNDAWYGRTGAPDQFLAITAMRAAENRVAVVRAANTGFSGIIDARGRIREKSGLFESGYVIADVELGDGPGASRASFFARHGGIFVRGCWLGVAVVVVIALRASRRIDR